VGASAHQGGYFSPPLPTLCKLLPAPLAEDCCWLAEPAPLSYVVLLRPWARRLVGHGCLVPVAAHSLCPLSGCGCSVTGPASWLWPAQWLCFLKGWACSKAVAATLSGSGSSVPETAWCLPSAAAKWQCLLEGAQCFCFLGACDSLAVMAASWLCLLRGCGCLVAA